MSVMSASRPEMAPRVVHLSTVHRADDVRIFHKQAKSLARAGYAVKIIARADAAGEEGGVAYEPLPLSRPHRLLRMTLGSWRLGRMAIREDADLYHVHDPELLPVGLILKLLGKTVVYDVHEDVPRQIRDKYWIPGVLRAPVARMFSLFQGVCVRFLDGAVAATPGIARTLKTKHVIAVQNFPVMDELTDQPVAVGLQEGSRLLYAGGLTAVRGAREMVQAMEIVGKDRDVRLTIAGSIRPAHLENELRAMRGWSFVDYLGWQNRRELMQTFSRCSLGLVLFHAAPNHLESQPNKLFEYMAAGLPVVASDFPFWRQFVEDVGCGIMVDPRDPDRIAEAITWLLDHPEEARAMGQRGRKAVVERFNWDQEARKLLDFYAAHIGVPDAAE